MKHQEIMELIDHFAGSGLQSMKLAQEGVSLVPLPRNRRCGARR